MTRTELEVLADELATYGFSRGFVENLSPYLDGGTEWNWEPGPMINVTLESGSVLIYLQTDKGIATVYDYVPATDNRYQIAEVADTDFAAPKE